MTLLGSISLEMVNILRARPSSYNRPVLQFQDDLAKAILISHSADNARLRSCVSGVGYAQLKYTFWIRTETPATLSHPLSERTQLILSHPTDLQCLPLCRPTVSLELPQVFRRLLRSSQAISILWTR